MDNRKHNPEKSRFPLSVFEILTTVISIAGFVIVVVSLKSTENAVSTGSYLQTYGWTLDIDKMLIDNARLRPYFVTDGTPKIPADSDAHKVDAIAEYMLDNFDAVINNRTYFKLDPESGELWRKAVRRYFRNSPALSGRFQKDSLLYSTTLRSVYNDRLTK